MPIDPNSFRFHLDPETSVATILLDRPDRMNALTFEVYEELRQTFERVADEGVRAVVLSGRGKAFCTGGDVHEIIGPLLERDADGLLEFTRMTCALVAAIRACPRPVIAALNGTTAGAGAVIAAACDMRIAAASTRIAFLFPKVGLSGADMGIAWLLPRLVGLGRASELLLTGRFVDAEEAADMGLVNQVTADAERALEVALDLAESLARGPIRAHAVTKAALEREADMDLEEALEAEARAQAELMTEPDFREAYRAFVDKREPRFE